MQFRRFLALLLLTGIAGARAIRAAQIDADAVLQLLVRKGIVTSAEAAQLRHEAATAPAGAAPTTIPPVRKTPAVPSTVPVLSSAVWSPRAALGFRIGNATFTPFGFMDLKAVHRSTNVGGGIGTSFGAIPFSNTVAGQNSETRISAQNSRLGLRIDSQVEKTRVLGFFESDFLGNAPANLNVSSNSDTWRMRLYFADLRRGDWEVIGGQAWSLLTPTRTGAGSVPQDMFLTSGMDTAFHVGLVWVRQAQARVMFHASAHWTAALSVENADAYGGGANGGGVITVPSDVPAAQIDFGNSTSVPNSVPDVVGKVAYDGEAFNHRVHADAAGILRTFRFEIPGQPTQRAEGTGLLASGQLELVNGLNVAALGYWSDGGGRYIYGQAPDYVLRLRGSGAYEVAPIRADSYLGGLEWQALPEELLYAYAGVIQIGREYGRATNGAYVGYGYPGSPNSQNREIGEMTIGDTHTLWKSATEGAVQISLQFSHVFRRPGFVASQDPAQAKLDMLYFNFRYVLP